MTSLDLDKVNCKDFQIVLHQYSLYPSKVCGSERRFLIHPLEIRELVLLLLGGST